MRLLVVGAAAMAATSLLISLASCSTAPPPEPPTKSEATSTSTSKKKSTSKGGDDDATDTDSDKDSDDAADDETSTGTDDDDELPPEPASFVRIPADVGDQSTKDAVKACMDSGKVFNRFSGDSGECTTVNLAKVDCTVDGVKKLLSATQLTQFEEALAGAYSGWTLDQCGDCPAAAGSLCTTTAGAEQIGTKLFFAKEEADQIKGKAMLLPIRPYQPADGSSAPSVSPPGTTATETATETAT